MLLGCAGATSPEPAANFIGKPINFVDLNIGVELERLHDLQRFASGHKFAFPD